MIHVKKIKWSFEDTEFEDLLYEEARKILILPKNLKIKDLDIELDDDSYLEEVEEYLTENYGFEVKSFEIDE